MNFKTIVLSGTILLVSVTGYSQALKFKIDGKIEQSEPAKAILQYSSGDKFQMDTVELKNGSFRFSGEIQKPVRAILSVLKESDNPRMMMGMTVDGKLIGRDGTFVYLDKGNIEVKGKDLKTAKVTGSKAHEEYMALEKKFEPVYKEINSINEQISKIKDRNSEEYKKLSEKISNEYKNLNPIEEEFIRSNPKSWVSWNILAGKSIISNPALYSELFELFDARFTESEDGQKLKDNIQRSFATSVGQPAPLFTQNDPNGKPVSLESLKGKYVLIDFWASWCGPCRAENPFVVKAYDLFKDKNFEILGVSLDDKKEPWLKAIKDDGLPWLQVSDLKGWKNEVAQQYFIVAVPQSFLLDPNGVIIAKNLRGDALVEKLKQILD